MPCLLRIEALSTAKKYKLQKFFLLTTIGVVI